MQSIKDYEDDQEAQGSMRITDLANNVQQQNESAFDLNQFEIESLTAFEQDGTKLQYISSLSHKSEDKAGTDQIIEQVNQIIQDFDREFIDGPSPQSPQPESANHIVSVPETISPYQDTA
jgi:predicted ATP-grasp superfamily ATP-dependent carboligase